MPTEDELCTALIDDLIQLLYPVTALAEAYKNNIEAGRLSERFIRPVGCLLQAQEAIELALEFAGPRWHEPLDSSLYSERP
jgi:hypothetical protein